MKALTVKQVNFANEYLETGNATEAADRAYKPKNRNTAHAIGAENLRKPTIREFLEQYAHAAASTIHKLSQKAKSEAVRLNASKDILDRAGYFTDKAKPQESAPLVIHIVREAAEKYDIKGIECRPDCIRGKSDAELERIAAGSHKRGVLTP